ncbi:MAG: phosphotransferase [Acidobacteria bacterium]|nr:phosphotransferase [Acidobacteriota bacterium]
MKSFVDSLPEDLVGNVRSMCGRRGEEWLKSLPELILAIETRWNIRTGTVYPASGINYVAPAESGSGELSVLKISPPYDTTEFASEAAYLRARCGASCVELRKIDDENRCMLLERAVPGETMDVIFDGREPECVAPAIEVLRSVSKDAAPPPKDAIRLDDWFDNLRRAYGTDFPSAYLRRALEIYERSSSGTSYLHGDFHPRNIVSADREPFLLIDPKGIVGHLGYEAAVFLNNFHWWQEDRPDIADRLDVAVRQFAEGLGSTEQATHEWAFAQMVIGAWWTFDELPDQYDNDVAKADIWGIL